MDAETRRLFRAAFAHSPVSSVLYARDGRPVVANAAFEALWGTSVDALPAGYSAWSDPQLVDSGIAAELRRAFDGATVRLPAVCYDGARAVTGAHRRWVAAHAYPLRDDGEEAAEVRWVVVQHEDVTAAFEADASQAAGGRRRDAALLAGEVGTFEWDIVAQRVWGDPNFARMFGIPLDADGTAPLERYIDVIHPEDRARMQAAVARTVEGAADYEIEYRVMDGASTGDVRPRWLLVRAKPERETSGGRAGRVVRAYGVCLDVTAGREAEEELRRRSLLLEAISESTGDVIYAKDRAGRLTYGNRATFALIGRPAAEVLGRTDAEFLRDAEVARRVMDNDRRIMEGGEADEVEEEVPLADGSSRVWASHKMPYRDGGGVIIGLLGVSRDVTARKRAEAERERLLEVAESARAAAEAANAAKSQFLANMSHELRTPLNAIGGYAELLELGLRGELTDAQRTDLARIRQSQRHLLGLINEVLNYAKLETGAVYYEVEPVRMRETLADAETLVAPQARARSLSLAVAACGDDMVARADGEKVRQVLVNLLSNAVKFTEPGGAIELGCAQAGDRVRVTVRDTGIGIPPEQLARIFDPFVQVRPEFTRTAEGTGLGLAISRDLARGMGGDLTVRSEVGAGSTFTLELPADSHG